MKFKRSPALTLCFLFSFVPTAPAWSPSDAVDPSTVVIVANENIPESVEIAEFYQKMRNIPDGHLLLIDAGSRYKIARKEYIETIRNPLLEKLIQNNLINAIPGTADRLGRIQATLFENKIKYIVLVYGIPTTIGDTPPSLLDDRDIRQAWLSRLPVHPGYSFDKGKLARNGASVDTELSLLLKRKAPLNGFLPNPYFRNDSPDRVRDYLRVTRIDGPSPAAVYRLLKNTRAAEQAGLKGRAYVDHTGRSGQYQLASDWFLRVAETFRKLDFEVDEDPGGATFPPDSRFDAVALYAGWYSPKITGPFTLPDFKLSTGAVAAHLHSYSAAQIQSDIKGWVGPLVEMGACATFGNVAEPYMQFTHYFDLYFHCIAEGWNVVDASYYALPVLSWQGLTIGDPFYAPFKVSLDEQLERIKRSEPSFEDQYVFLRQANRLLKAGNPQEALSLVTDTMKKIPGPALAVVQATLIETIGKWGKRKQERDILTGVADQSPRNSSEWGLFALIADQLLKLGDADSALRIYKNILAREMTDRARATFLKRGLPVARKAGDKSTAADWERLLNPMPPAEASPANP